MNIRFLTLILVLTLLAPGDTLALSQAHQPAAAAQRAAQPAGRVEETDPPGELLSCPAWQAPPAASYQSFPDAGLYTFFDWRHLDPEIYPWLTGGHLVFTWRTVERDGPGQYRWDAIDQWMAAEASLGKPVGLAFNTYEGACCGGNQVPTWFNEAHGAWPAGDGYVTCAWADEYGQPQQEDIPMYWTPAYLTAFERFVQAAAERYRDDPRVAFVEVSSGIYGETMPGDPGSQVDDCLLAAGLTERLWIETVNRISDIYQRHWHDTPLLVQYAPWYLARRERREVSDYAGNIGVGLKHNRLIPDHDDQVIRSDTATIHPDVCRTGQYDPMLEFAGQVPLGWEGTASSYLTTADLLWSLLNGLNKHPAYLVMGWQPLTTADPVGRWALRLAARYAGVSIDTTPGVWVALRETQSTWYPQRGNFDFWLRQVDSAPGGRTVPQWNVTSHPWGRFTRRTDAATGNPDMFFAVDDAYLFDNATQPVTITVIYLDAGYDTWELQYDAIDDNARSAGVVAKANSNQWREAIFTLPDAQFSNQLNGYDFRIRSRGDGHETVSFVEVVKGELQVADGRLQVAGGTLQVAAEDSSAVRGNDQSTNIPIYQSSAPPNDDFDGATAIALPYEGALDTSGASVAADDPLMGCGKGQNWGTVWYRFTAPGDGFVALNTAGSDYDTVLAVWQGERGSLAGRGCNDDGGWWAGTSNLNVGVTGGQVYHVQVASRAASSGHLTLRVGFSACTYTADLATAQGVLAAYDIVLRDSMIELVTTPGGARCAITGLLLAGRELAAPLPATIGNLSNLQKLDLHGTGLPDPLPATMGALGQLQWLNLKENNLAGPLPAALANLNALQALELADNQLSGPLPDWIRSLPRLQRLYLSGNQLGGPLPAWVGELRSLEQLWLGYNRFDGPIADLGSLNRLRELSLAGNQLSGNLPAELAGLQRLGYLYLGDNGLSGLLPAWLGSLPALRVLSLENNQISGAVPAALGQAAQLEILRLDGNQLSGSLPASLGDLINLRGLSLHDNQLGGALPDSLGNLDQLTGLYVEQNQLSGLLPASLGSLSQLRRLHVAHNPLSGPLPASLTSLANLWSADLRSTALCEPDDDAFRAWRAGVRFWQGSGLTCGSTVTPAATATPTRTPTATATPSPTLTSSPTATQTATLNATATPTATAFPATTQTATSTATATASSTATPATFYRYLPLILRQ